jgi:hypothetical protein
VEIPAGGVIPLVGECLDANCAQLREISVSTAISELALPGHVEIAQADANGAWAYFVPDQPFAEGTWLLVASDAFAGAMLSTKVVAATKLGASSVTVASGLTKQRHVLETKCCPSVREGRERCLETSVETGAVFAAQLQATDAAASQYVFELSVREAGASQPDTQTDFRPLADSGLSLMMANDGAASSYCYTVRAQPLVGGAVIDLVEHCVDNHLEGIGHSERTPEEIEQWLDTCVAPPVDTGQAEADVDNTTSARDASAARDADHDARSEAETGGCQLRNGTAPASGALLWMLAALVPWLRSKMVRPTRLRGSKRS